MGFGGGSGFKPGAGHAGSATYGADSGDVITVAGQLTASAGIQSDGIIKQDNATYGGVTRSTVGVATLTLPKPNNTSAWVDTTVNLPALSVLRYIFLEKTTPGVNGNGTLHLSNVAMRSGGTTPDSDYDQFYSDWDVPGGGDKENGWNLEGAAGANDYTGHWVIHFPVDGSSARPAYTYAQDIWLKVKAVGNASGGTAPVVSLMVVYDTFDLS